ncbi:MAG: hypothetical protein KDK40_02225 [Chlamydiia bacterium]|nr:hypothetical protein [Chlamydiia bacterium]
MNTSLENKFDDCLYTANEAVRYLEKEPHLRLQSETVRSQMTLQAAITALNSVWIKGCASRREEYQKLKERIEHLPQQRDGKALADNLLGGDAFFWLCAEPLSTFFIDRRYPLEGNVIALMRCSKSLDRWVRTQVIGKISNFKLRELSIWINSTSRRTDFSIMNKTLNIQFNPSRYRTLDLRHSKVRDEDLAFLGECKNLCKLVLEETTISSKGIKGLTVGLTSLHTLNLHEANVGNVGLTYIAEGCPNLTDLDIGSNKSSEVVNWGVEALSKRCPHLQKLNLSNTRVTVDYLSSLAVRCMQLQELRLSRTIMIDDWALNGQYWALNGRYGVFPNLKFLSLDSNYDRILGSGVVTLVEKCPKLETLLLYQTGFQDRHLPTMIPHLKNLTALDLRGTRITDHGLWHFARHWTHLNELTLDVGCEFGLTEEGVAAVSANNPKLKINLEIVGEW